MSDSDDIKTAEAGDYLVLANGMGVMLRGSAAPSVQPPWRERLREPKLLPAETTANWEER